MAIALAALGLLATVSLAPPPVYAQKKTTAKSEKKTPIAKPAPQQNAAKQKTQLMYSPWIKICDKGPQTNNKQVCVVRTDARLENGQPVLVAQIIIPEGASKKLQVIIPIPVHVQHGTRILLDQSELGKAPFVVCSPQIGCTSDYMINDATIDKLKKGKEIVVQAFNVFNTVISLPLPLKGFAKAYDGPPTDQKQLEAQQRKLQSELQKKAEEARKKLEEQQPAKKK